MYAYVNRWRTFYLVDFVFCLLYYSYYFSIEISYSQYFDVGNLDIMLVATSGQGILTKNTCVLILCITLVSTMAFWCLCLMFSRFI